MPPPDGKKYGSLALNEEGTRHFLLAGKSAKDGVVQTRLKSLLEPKQNQGYQPSTILSFGCGRSRNGAGFAANSCLFFGGFDAFLVFIKGIDYFCYFEEA